MKRRHSADLIEALDCRRLFAQIAWDGGGNGTSWTDPLNWSSDTVPGVDDDVLIASTSGNGVVLQNLPPTVTTIRSLTVGDGVNAAILTIGINELAVSMPTQVRAGATLRVSSATISGFQGAVNDGTIELLSGTLQGSIENRANLLVQGSSSVGALLGTSNSTLRVEATTGSSSQLLASAGADISGAVSLTSLANSAGATTTATLRVSNAPLHLRASGSISTQPGQFAAGQYTVFASAAQIDGPITAAATTRLNLSGNGPWTGSATVTNFGTLTLPNGAFSTPIDNAGTVLCDRPGVNVTGLFNNRENSLIRIEAGLNSADVAAGFTGGLVNRGRIELWSRFAKVPRLQLGDQPLTNEPSGIIVALPDGDDSIPGTLAPDRRIEGVVRNRGLITLTAASPTQLKTQLSITTAVANEGTIVVPLNCTMTSGPVELLAGGRLSGRGTVVGNVINTSGNVEPNDVGGAGRLTIQGNYTQHGGGTFTHDFTSSARDELIVSGSVSLGGALVFRPGTPLNVNQVADPQIITGSSVIGTFDSFPGEVVQSNGVIIRARVTPTAVVQAVSPQRPALPNLPQAFDTGASDTDNITRLTSLQITGTAVSSRQVELFVGESSIGFTAVTGETYSMPLALPEGVHSIRLRGADASGDWSALSTPLIVTVDVTSPIESHNAFDFEAGQFVNWHFDEPMSANVLPTIINEANTQPIPPNSITVVAPTVLNSLRFRIAAPTTDANYTATLPAATSDLAGNPAQSLTALRFFIFAADANRDRAVNISDFSILASRFNLPGTFSQGDFNYDGTTNISDFAILASKFNTTLPAARGVPTSFGMKVFASVIQIEREWDGVDAIRSQVL